MQPAGQVPLETLDDCVPGFLKLEPRQRLWRSQAGGGSHLSKKGLTFQKMKKASFRASCSVAASASRPPELITVAKAPYAPDCLYGENPKKHMGQGTLRERATCALQLLCEGHIHLPLAQVLLHLQATVSHRAARQRRQHMANERHTGRSAPEQLTWLMVATRAMPCSLVISSAVTGSPSWLCTSRMQPASASSQPLAQSLLTANFGEPVA